MRIEFPRVLRQAGQKGGFRVAQIADWFAEVVIRRRRQADVQIAKIEPVYIRGENLVLAPHLLEPDRLDAFDNLCPDRARTALGNLD